MILKRRTLWLPENFFYKSGAFELCFGQRGLFTLNLRIVPVVWVPLEISIFDLAYEIQTGEQVRGKE